MVSSGVIFLFNIVFSRFTCKFIFSDGRSCTYLTHSDQSDKVYPSADNSKSPCFNSDFSAGLFGITTSTMGGTFGENNIIPILSSGFSSEDPDIQLFKLPL